MDKKRWVGSPKRPDSQVVQKTHDFFPHSGLTSPKSKGFSTSKCDMYRELDIFKIRNLLRNKLEIFSKFWGGIFWIFRGFF